MGNKQAQAKGAIAGTRSVSAFKAAGARLATSNNGGGMNALDGPRSAYAGVAGKYAPGPSTADRRLPLP